MNDIKYDSNNQIKTRTINNQNWIIYILLTNITNDTQISLFSSNILKFQLNNSLQQPVPDIEIIYKDYAFSLTEFLKVNGTIFTVYLYKSTTSKQQNNAEMLLNYDYTR